jgi:electron transfer flavoprotein beta subunit
MEAAIRIKEEIGGTITVVTLGDEESEDTLRRALAMGGDRGLLLNDEAFSGGDPYATARALHGALKDTPFDLLLTGVQADDDGYGQVGSILAELFQLPHACMVNRLDIHGTKLHVHRELEGGLEEACELDLPAVLSIQTGINEPRYVSIMGIRKARSKELQEVEAEETGLSEEELGEAGSLIEIKELYLPAVEKQAEILSGSVEEISDKVMGILKDRGGL